MVKFNTEYVHDSKRKLYDVSYDGIIECTINRRRPISGHLILSCKGTPTAKQIKLGICVAPDVVRLSRVKRFTLTEEMITLGDVHIVERTELENSIARDCEIYGVIEL